MTALDYRILGPIELAVDGVPVPTGPPRQRAVLAMLLLGGGRTVPVRRLVDGLWPVDPPRSAVKNVQVYVYLLRKSVGSRLQSSASGYRLEPGTDLDLVRFREMLALARQLHSRGDAHVAIERYRQALALWRGPALADLVGRDLLTAEADHLEQVRLQAIDEYFCLEYAAGQFDADVDPLVAEHPLAEVLRWHQIRFLCAAGRTVQAMAAYRDACAVLDRELGAPPGRRLRDLARQTGLD
ncbi:MAG TPA: BTAD domain-containing putative transcriptional regulator [Micromonosporaceae bacterium]|nr:BTAD domain-containing putative transcriptional regulator [Micromonosporaceae bacterium]